MIGDSRRRVHPPFDVDGWDLAQRFVSSIRVVEGEWALNSSILKKSLVTYVRSGHGMLPHGVDRTPHCRCPHVLPECFSSGLTRRTALRRGSRADVY